MDIASQLSLHHIPEGSQAFDINRLDATRNTVGPASTRGSAESALAERVVDDRVFNMGMTNWKAVIDRAILLGHTELFDSEFNRQGLRTHGHRYSPVPLLPERAVEYVKSRVLVIGARKLTKKTRDQLGVTTELASGKALLVKLSATTVELSVSLDDQVVSLQVAFEEIAFSDGREADDIKVLGKQLSAALKRQASKAGLALKMVAKDVDLLGRRVLTQLVKIQELSAWNA